MSVFLHNYWQYLFVIACAVLLGLEIPRKAIFFEPRQAEGVVPFASFVTYDEKTYADLMKHVQVSWKIRPGMISGVAADIGGDIDALVLEQEHVPLGSLPVGDFLPDDVDGLPKNRAIVPHRSLKPRTLAAGEAVIPVQKTGSAGDSEKDVSRPAKELLEIPGSLKDLF